MELNKCKSLVSSCLLQSKDLKSEFPFLLIEWKGVQRHVGRLSHLTTVGLMLIQTQTWRGEDYCRLFEHHLRKLFKEGIIKNIQQYLSALCKESYQHCPPCSTLSLTFLPVHIGRL